jgi:hypothetical protein
MMIDVAPQTPAALITLRRAYLLTSLLLLVQFVLGQAVNLFVTIPKHHPGAQPSNYLTGSVRSIGWAIPDGGMVLAAHVVLGLALVLGGIVVIVLAVRSRSRLAIGTAGLGGAAILGAAFNGASFLDFNQDFSSMIMAGLFAVALGSYVVGLASKSMQEGLSGPERPL